jgi:AmmeMemoRadiSam system protein A
MSLVYSAVCPHPPIVVPEVGGKEAAQVKNTAEAMLEIGRRIKSSGAEILIMISPHSPVFEDAIAIHGNKTLHGNLGRFGASQVALTLACETGLVEQIIKTANENGILAVELNQQLAGKYKISLELDHGLMVPLYFLRQSGVELPVVAIAVGLLPFEELYAFGIAVQRAVQNYSKKAALLASGDMSHCLKKGAPCGYDPKGEEFDRAIVRLTAAADVEGIIGMQPELLERAAECGFRPLLMLLGALDGYKIKSEVLSYEGPFGVGYMVASLAPQEISLDRKFSHRWLEIREEQVALRRSNESYLVQLARNSLESNILGKSMDMDTGQAPPEFRKKSGVFVCIKREGRLRGCIGTVFPQQKSIADEVVVNAVSAGLHDHRFLRVQPEELSDLVYSVDVLTEPEAISSIKQLDPAKYGVIVRSGHKSGLLLPNLEGVDNVEQQVQIAREKAGIRVDQDVSLERFEVIRYS